MNYRHLLLLVVVGLLAVFGAPTQAQDNTDPVFASVEDGALILSGGRGDIREVMSAYNFQDLRWNADGSKLAFILYDRDYVASLGVVDAASGEVTMFSIERLEYGFNLNWTLDGRILFASSSPANNPSAGAAYLVDVQAVAPETGAATEVLGTVEFGTGCGGGSPLPSDHVYTAETGGFRGFFLTLADTPYGIVYSLNCGGVGIGLLNSTTGERATVATNFAKVVISPDGSRAAGVEQNFEDHSVSRTLIYDLSTLEAVEVAAVGEPDQLAWSRNGENLYYSTRTPDTNLLDDLSDQQRVTINELFGTTMEALYGYKSTIHRVRLADQSDELIFEGDAYAIGKIVELGDAVYFSQVPNLDTWLEKLLNGEVHYDDFESTAPFVEPAVLRLALAQSSEAVFLGWFDQFTPIVIVQARAAVVDVIYYIAADSEGVEQVYQRLIDSQSEPRQITRVTEDVITFGVAYDGLAIAYISEGQLWLQPIHTEEPQSLAALRTAPSTWAPVFSQDGQFIAYADGGVRLLDLGTRETQLLLEDADMTGRNNLSEFRRYAPQQFVLGQDGRAEKLVVDVGVWELESAGVYDLTNGTFVELAGQDHTEIIPLDGGFTLVYGNNAIAGEPALSIAPSLDQINEAVEVVSFADMTDKILFAEHAVEIAPQVWDPLESTCRHASLSIL